LFGVDGAEQRQQLEYLDEDATVCQRVVLFDLVGQQVEVVVVKLSNARQVHQFATVFKRTHARTDTTTTELFSRSFPEIPAAHDYVITA